MAKNKLEQFKKFSSFDFTFEPDFNEFFKTDYHLKGKWNKEVFKNNNPIVLELGCGKGEYATNLALQNPNKNFIGVDIKGNRMWKGANLAYEENLNNIAFLRTQIEFIDSFFAKNEVDEIWITFPDPQLKKRRNKKRLTSALFLNKYKTFLNTDCFVNLKTDNTVLYNYTLNLLKENALEINISTNDLYMEKNQGISELSEAKSIKTFYEKLYLEKGEKIKFIKFKLNKKNIDEPKTEE
ncbi:MAG: tRNA (guanosine(46)-N7)-methyltransferase TrmB [Bacteroidetes bacterium]|nr:MAG: tRNA (guanosine(46)-N7)-methyltransferase TrmB [Bacteroidota bacterium]